MKTKCASAVEDSFILKTAFEEQEEVEEVEDRRR